MHKTQSNKLLNMNPTLNYFSPDSLSYECCYIQMCFKRALSKSRMAF